MVRLRLIPTRTETKVVLATTGTLELRRPVRREVWEGIGETGQREGKRNPLELPNLMPCPGSGPPGDELFKFVIPTGCE